MRQKQQDIHPNCDTLKKDKPFLTQREQRIFHGKTDPQIGPYGVFIAISSSSRDEEGAYYRITGCP
jgi:hypothetical protein